LILLVLATVVTIFIGIVAIPLRRWAFAGKLLAGAVVAWVVYLGLGTLVAVRAPQHILAPGEDRCFDEMCFAVTGWNRMPSRNAGRSIYLVTVRITNQSRGRAERELGRKGVLIDRFGQVYGVSNQATRALSPANGPTFPGLDAEVGAGQHLETTLVFDLPTTVEYPGFALDSNLTMNPARIELGNEDHFLHWPTVWPLD
jgi:hypothetical protein